VVHQGYDAFEFIPFLDMKSRFDEVATTCPAEMLHVATLTQEVGCKISYLLAELINFSGLLDTRCGNPSFQITFRCEDQ
jgi:hypothetical protein